MRCNSVQLRRLQIAPVSAHGSTIWAGAVRWACICQDDIEKDRLALDLRARLTVARA